MAFVELLTLPAVHLVDLLERQECQHTDALEHIGIVNVAPVLVELKGRGLIRVEPDGALGGLAHLFALGIEQERNRHSVCIFAELTTDELRAAEHVRPLVVAAELHVAAVVLEHVVEVVALHDHVVELEEGQALLHALLVALSTQHVVHREACSDLAQKLNVVERLEPLGIVEHERLAVREVNEALHLTLEALGIVFDGLLSKHLAHIGAAGGSPMSVVPSPMRAMGLFPAICRRFIRHSAMK